MLIFHIKKRLPRSEMTRRHASLRAFARRAPPFTATSHGHFRRAAAIPAAAHASARVRRAADPEGKTVCRINEKKRHLPMKKASFRLETRFFPLSIRSATEDAGSLWRSINF